VRAMPCQHPLLCRGRCQAVPGHTKTLANTPDIPEEVKRRFRPASLEAVMKRRNPYDLLTG
jgi:hypothetical protein